MSIRPAYAEAILDGSKTVELRRKRPSFARGSRVLVYSSSPSQRVNGTFEVGRILADAPEALWPLVAERAGIDRERFDAYFRGCSTAYAIEVENPRRIEPCRLAIRPPQSYLFLRSRERRHRGLLRLARA
ncbi:MAG TPA: ASCH domain-containing protein [Solirubrobacteraceae bacterium]|nr:ASCH domain-containing protein [Solirubrobacteraceae bacterium]